MRIKKVWAVYFSGTGTTEKTVRRIAAGMAQALDAELAVYDFTTPAARQRELRFGAEELVVLGVPVYAGRVPNVLLPYLTKQLHGGGERRPGAGAGGHAVKEQYLPRGALGVGGVGLVRGNGVELFVHYRFEGF